MSEQRIEVSADKYKYWVVDYERRELLIIDQDDARHSEPLDAEDLPAQSPLTMSIIDWEKWWIVLRTNQNHVVIWAGFNPNSGGPPPHRPTVYLDQNKWSLLTLARTAPERFDSREELEAAYQLVEWARDDGVLLPVSSGHMLETSALYDQKRYDVGITIADLCGGWQMRHPLDVLEHEAAIALQEHLSLKPVSPRPTRSIVTTEPNAWEHSDEFGFGDVADTSIETFMEMLTAPAVVVSQLIDPDAISREPATRWVEHHQAITSQVARSSSLVPTRRRTALRRFWNENKSFYQRALLDQHASAEALYFSNRELTKLFGRTPTMSLLSEMFVQRFLDRQSTWKQNDLVDMLFLSTAAGHCDYVVAENRTGSQLRQIQKARGTPPTVFTTLRDLVSHLDAAGVTTDTQRRAQAEQSAAAEPLAADS